MLSWRLHTRAGAEEAKVPEKPPQPAIHESERRKCDGGIAGGGIAQRSTLD